MNAKKIVKIALLIFVAASAAYLIYKESVPAPARKNNAQAQSMKPPSDGDYLIVYFFHGTARCPSCRTIEAFGREAVEKGFPKEVKSGKIIWKDIDLDEPENAHFSQDFQIISISLVLAGIKNGKQKRWRNLEEVWNLLKDKDGFILYVREEIKAWL